MWKLVLAFCGLGTVAEAARNYTTMIQVTNGAQWGSWQEPEFCPGEQFAIGYDMKYEKYQFTGDDTALNSIALICSDFNGAHHGQAITSGQGPWGEWKGRVTCNQYPGSPSFLVAFSLEVESPQDGLDDNAASWIKFQCRDFESTESPEVLNKDPGDAHVGSFGEWSFACPTGTAICGLKTKVEGNQGDGDDTALNDVQFYCCPKPSGGGAAVGK